MRPHVSNMFQIYQDLRFFEKLNDNSYEHIQALLMLCDIINREDIPGNAFQMLLLPHTLKGGTREWLYSLPLGSIVS